MGEVAGEAAVASEALHQVVCVVEAALHPRPEHGLGEALEAADCCWSLVHCQNRNINILTRVCRELTRLSRSKHTLVK